MKKLLASLLILFVLVVFSSCRININLGSKAKDLAYEKGSGSIKEEIDEIEIDWVSGQVTIDYGDVEGLQFSETSDEDIDSDEEMYYKVDGKTLKIEYMEPGISLNIKSLSKDLKVTLPKELELKNLSLDVVSADADIKSASFIKEIDLQSVSGNINAALQSGAKEINLDSVSGNFNINIPDTGFEVDFDTISGEIGSDFENLKISKHSEFIYGDGSMDIDGDTVSGSIYIGKL
ncbi:MAG: DUF4097 domain-containing protein [Firmicutes bacterium]|nr:DUF4097 domain-containing protein [Bacillota bacterium]